MGPTKRKRTSAAETSPPQKRARRVLKQSTIPIIDVREESDTSETVAPRKRKKAKATLAEPESAPSPKKKKKAKVQPPPVTGEDDSNSDSDALAVSAPAPKKKKAKARAPPPVASEDSDSDTPVVASTSKRRIQRKVQSDSDEDEDDAPKKRLRRVVKRSPMDDEESDDPPRKGRLRRKSDSEDEVKAPAPTLLQLDSDDEPEDLELPTQLTISRPTKKDLKSSALARYAKARKNKSSPAPVPADAIEEKGKEREFTPFSDAEEDGLEDVAEEEEAVDDAEDTFIVDEDDADADPDAALELERMRYSSRELDEHFAVFVEYIIALHSDSNYLSTATEKEKEYFNTAVTALRRHIDPLADSMTLSTWKAPFIATLNLRPILEDGLSTEGTGDCHACWTRGMYACDISGAYILSTRKGIYDHDTFERKSEKKIKYGKATQFENNAEARSLPYPPQFELVIGQRCFNRALAYHEARHYMYNVSVRVKEKIQSLCEDDAELENDPNALLQAMKDEHWIEYLWGQFKSDRKMWSQWANRKDHDSLV
ncbi:DUF4211 domain-containing protein [Mycena sanguinolenta]|uniref:DUF4211 domain-containing protein n=1 Tax=Mycena sanguinolenta TaxID=230812 RepID=A0A8H7D567_9AGAR|nr:DUF4211 domain-containing protein [Mycena sanguinolenta]